MHLSQFPMTLAGSAGDALEENAPLASPTSTSSRSTVPKNGDQVRRRLAVCLFLYIAGMAIVMQIYPKVSKRVCACEYVVEVRRRASPEMHVGHGTHPKNADEVVGTAVLTNPNLKRGCVHSSQQQEQQQRQWHYLEQLRDLS